MDTSAIPTKNNLMRLQGKIKLSEQGHDLLEKKKFILTVEKGKYEQKREQLKTQLKEDFEVAYKKLINASIDIGIDELINISEEIKIEDSVNIKYKTVMGVEIPSIIFEEQDNTLQYGLYGTTSAVDETIIEFNNIKKKIILLAELENTISRLNKAINKVTTRSNALKDIIIPNDKKIEHEIKNILEEREREEFARLKIIKGRMN